MLPEAALLDGAGNGNTPPAMPEYANSLPQELRTPSFSGVLGKYKDMPSFAQGIENALKFQGRAIPVPDANATPEQIAQWKAEHGPKLNSIYADRMPPENAGDYEFKFE